jgi:2-polyprenyl-3-methyl-5-hydroxy-6-metoxy-1,4-benzoquinol methylase
VPFSSNAFDHYIGTLVGLLRPAMVCDIGPGAGKYGKLIKKRAAEDGFSSHVTAIEIDESYVEQYGLEAIYDTITISDASNLLTTPRVRFDLVMIGDCIEHMRKSAGLDLLNFLVYRSGHICVVYPESFVQDDWDGHMAEAHISTWSPEDFKGWKTLHHSWSAMHLFLIKGYQPSRMIITG